MKVKEKVAFQYEPVLDKAFNIAVSTIDSCRGYGSFMPDSESYYEGIWVADTVFTLEAYRYFGNDTKEILKSIIKKLGDRPHKDGYIPAVFRGKEEIVGYGGRYDLAHNKKQNRDLEGPYLFIHANYMLWKYFDNDQFIRKYFGVMLKSLICLEKRRDPVSKLILSTYGPASCDTCVDDAVPETTAYPYFTSLYIKSYQEFSEMALATGKTTESKTYSAKAEELYKVMNGSLWNKELNRYEVKILKTPVTTDKTQPTYNISEDARFPVMCNMLCLYNEIPDSDTKIRSLIRSIEKSENGLRVWGQSISPDYPDNYFTRVKEYDELFNNGNYHCGDVWTWFSNKYAIPLFKLGYPDKAMDLLSRQADVAVRDGGFSEYYDDDAEGRRKGAFSYAGSASSYMYALVEGLFGLKADYPNRKIFIHPSLKKTGRIRCLLGKHELDLLIKIDESKKIINLEINTTYSGNADFRVMIPGDSVKEGTSVFKEEKGILVAYIEKTGESTYVVFNDKLKSKSSIYRVSY